MHSPAVGRDIALTTPLEIAVVRVTRHGEPIAASGAVVFSARESSRSDPDAWFGRDARVFRVGRSRDTSRIQIGDRMEAGEGVWTVRDIEAGRWHLRITAERTT